MRADDATNDVDDGDDDDEDNDEDEDDGGGTTTTTRLAGRKAHKLFYKSQTAAPYMYVRSNEYAFNELIMNNCVCTHTFTTIQLST